MDVKDILQKARIKARLRDVHIERQNMLLRTKKRREDLGLNTEYVDKDIQNSDSIIAAADEVLDEARYLISCLRDEEYDVMYFYYICGFSTWDRVAAYMHYSIRNIYKLHESALEILTARKENTQ